MDFSFSRAGERFRAELPAFLIRALPMGWRTPASSPPDDIDEPVRFDRRLGSVEKQR